MPFASKTHKNEAHESGGDAEEVGAVLPWDGLGPIDQAEVRPVIDAFSSGSVRV
jgi:hypothetical protein